MESSWVSWSVYGTLNKVQFKKGNKSGFIKKYIKYIGSAEQTRKKWGQNQRLGENIYEIYLFKDFHTNMYRTPESQQ